MSRPEERQRSRTPAVAVVALIISVVGVVVLAFALVTLDIRRSEQVRDLEVQLESLRHLVEAMGKQLEHHDKLINTTLHAKSTPRSEPAEEVEYEGEYDYDEEDEYEEYDEEDERNTKATVKRTIILSENSSSEEPTRHKRQVDVHEERYVPSSPHLYNLSRSKSEGLRIYATFFGKNPKYKVSSERSHHLKHSTTFSTERQRRPSLHKAQPHSPVYQEQERAPETVRYRHRNSRARSRQSNERATSLEYTRELSQPDSFVEQQPRVVAAHYTGDTSKYNQRDHHHYYGNDLLYHPHNFFKDWSPSGWMTEDDIRFFPIQDGKIKIQKSGIYFVYAQIFYSATHNHCGFHIKRNDDEVAQCTTSTAGAGLKRNTCYTALALRLERQDLLWVKEVEGHRNTSFRDSHSFFGLIKLGPT